MKMSIRTTIRLIVAGTLWLSAGSLMADAASDVAHLQQRWAEVNYQLEGKTRLSAFEQLVADAESMVAANPDSAEVLIWSGIVKSTYAGAKGGLGALSFAKASKADLEKALALNADALWSMGLSMAIRPWSPSAIRPCFRVPSGPSPAAKRSSASTRPPRKRPA